MPEVAGGAEGGDSVLHPAGGAAWGSGGGAGREDGRGGDGAGDESAARRCTAMGQRVAYLRAGSLGGDASGKKELCRDAVQKVKEQ